MIPNLFGKFLKPKTWALSRPFRGWFDFTLDSTSDFYESFVN